MNAAPTQTCPKCGHTRAPDTRAPQWQCPACGIAYHKYRAPQKTLHSIVTPPAAGSMPPPVTADGSVWFLVFTNVVALGVAIYESWPLAVLMLLYWSQSVVIGIANVFRMLALERFSTENFTMNGRAVDPTPESKRQVAFFFLVHFGIFHLVYLVFLTVDKDVGQYVDAWLMTCVALFVLNHAWSYRYNIAIDRMGTPNIGTLMFTPYFRILPMHLTIIFGGMFGPSTVGLLLFGTLKIAADAGMHLVEHHTLRKIRESATGT